MVEPRKLSIVKPTLDTPFHIDFDWWRDHDREWRVHLRGLLSPEIQEKYADIINGDELIDWVDPETAEIQQVDGLQHVVITHSAHEEGFLDPHTALVEAVFRFLLINGNTPMTVVELGEGLNRDPKHLLRLLSGVRVYRGIRPIIV
ncbi:MAG: hypothetical protein JW757_05215 [Anaerolineales bacterium]|nr:hypothetical protein [Anaerolineales bacterium]